MIKNRSTKIWISVIALVAAVTGGGVAAAGNRSAHQLAVAGSDPTTFTVVERAISDVVVYVNPIEDDVVGNTLGFGNPLYNAKNTEKVGRDQGFCYRTNPGKSWECTWTNVLPEGRITVQGVFPDSLADSKMAITGGTGAYKEARGYMLLHSRNDLGTEFDFTFYIR